MIYEFTEADLKSNQRGVITAGQKEMIDGLAKGISGMQWGNARIGIIFLFVILCLFFAFFLSNESLRSAFLADPTILIVLFLTVPLIIGIFAISVYFANRRANRLSNAELRKVEGVVKLDESHSANAGTAYYVKLGKIKFGFPEDVSSIFPENSKVRIYYCETSMLKLILSHEKID